jgi:hypothetical protein
VPELPGVAVPGAPVAGDVFGLEEPVQAPETAMNLGP